MSRGRSVRSGFEQRFLASLRAAGIDRRERLTVGFSGGVDSLALASAFARVRPLLDPEVLLAHVDHRLRPNSADATALCASLAHQLGLPFRSTSLEAGLQERSHGLGIEEAARRERYLALAEVARSWDSSAIVLGHQANDQAETLLMHLFRGAGLAGLTGMKSVERRQIPWWERNSRQIEGFILLRPLLKESRTRIDAYVADLGLAQIVDESNSSIEFDRNWIRHEVIPSITTRWPGAIQSMGRTAEVIGLDSKYLDQLAEAVSEKEDDGTVRSVCTDVLLELPPPVAMRWIHRWLETLDSREATFDVVARCYELARSGDETVEIQAGQDVAIVNAAGCLTTLEALIDSTIERVPIVGKNGQPRWNVSLTEITGELATAHIEFPSDLEVSVRALRFGDRWAGTHQSPFEDLRVAGIHPLLRTRVLAVASTHEVLLIPAIYPTIRRGSIEHNSRRLEVRWWKSA